MLHECTVLTLCHMSRQALVLAHQLFWLCRVQGENLGFGVRGERLWLHVAAHHGVLLEGRLARLDLVHEHGEGVAATWSRHQATRTPLTSS